MVFKKTFSILGSLEKVKHVSSYTGNLRTFFSFGHFSFTANRFIRVSVPYFSPPQHKLS